MLWKVLNFFNVKNAQQAAYRRQCLAIAYAFIGWNSFMVLFYILYKDQMPEDKNQQKIKLMEKLGKDHTVHSIRIEGLTVTENQILEREKENNTGLFR